MSHEDFHITRAEWCPACLVTYPASLQIRVTDPSARTDKIAGTNRPTATGANMATKTPATPITLSLTFKKETPGTFVFEEAKPADGSRVIIGTLYVSKAALPVQPASITVTVTPVA